MSKKKLFKVMATSYDFYDAFIEANSEDEAYEIASNGIGVDWVKADDQGDWQIHGDMTTELTDD